MKNERGISLMEVVVAVAIMATVLLFLSRGFLTSMFMTRQSDEYAAAARAAREKMEEIVSMTFRHYHRKLNGSNVDLQIDPKTGQYMTRLASAKFDSEPNGLPLLLRMESVDGPRGPASATPKSAIYPVPEMSGFDKDPFGRLHPFRVYLTDINADDPNSTQGLLPGLVDDYAGEVILITGETNEKFATDPNFAVAINTANIDEVHGVGSYGGDLLPRDGKPDGFLSFTMPVDLNGDGDFTDNTKALGSKQMRYPVGVVIRWQGRYGPERYETWTVISSY